MLPPRVAEEVCMARRSVGFPLALGIVSAILALVLAVLYWVLALGDVRAIERSAL